MDKLIKKLDELFEKYQVEEADIKEVGSIINELGGEIVMEGEEYAEGEKDGEYDEEDGFGKPDED